jgi:hypothetical protein
MSASNEWQEYHLTPRGWVPGNYKHDGGSGEVTVPEPPDSVAVYRYREKIPSMYSLADCTTSLVRTIGSQEAVVELLDRFGPCPTSL